MSPWQPAFSRSHITAARGWPWLRPLLLTLSAVFFALHFVHLRADFPNDSPWIDWAKYTDEGWYGDAAIRHFLLGHWYVPGDFNPAVALPVWPLLLAMVFHFTGVSLLAARVLTVCVFGVTLWALLCLLDRFPIRREHPQSMSLAGPLTVFLLCVSPFFFAFGRMAILEPLLALLTVLSLLVASYLTPWQHNGRSNGSLLRSLWPSLALGLLLPAAVLTKTTAVALFPAIAAMLWHRAGHRWRPALMMALLPLAIAATLWGGYMLLLVRPHYTEDYQYLFSANGYTGFQLQPLATVIYNTVADGQWIGIVLYAAFFPGLILAACLRPRFFRNPLISALLLWTGGYFVFLAYHNNLQPRYYLLPAVAITGIVACLIEEFSFSEQAPATARNRAIRGILLTALVAAIAVPEAMLQMNFLLHPEYTFVTAAHAIAAIVRAEPRQSPLVLSISGSDLSLMTGLPSIDDDFGTLDLDQRVRQYRPGWYVAWNQIEDDKMDALAPLYHPVRVASFPAMDDPERDELILYRLDPAEPTSTRTQHMKGTPKPLRTRLGQQPTTSQLQH